MKSDQEEEVMNQLSHYLTMSEIQIHRFSNGCDMPV